MGRLIAWIRALFSELKRRRVFRAAAVYAVAAWIVLQVAAITVPALYLPHWVLTVLVVIAVAGLPVTLAGAWAFDITPEGIRRTREADPDQPGISTGSPVVRSTLFLLVLVVSALGAWGAWSVWLRPAATGPEEPVDEPVALSATRIAVLPFDDLSADEELSGVTAGLTEALIQELDRVEGLELVSRNGVEPFGEPEIPLDSIARTLNAGSLIEGSIEQLDGKLKLSVNLVDGTTDTRLASIQLERKGEELLALRDDLVAEVARSIRKELGEEVRLREGRAGTEEDRAWELYHRARQQAEFADTLRLAGDSTSAGRLYARADSMLARAESLDPDWTAPTVQRGWVAYRRAKMAAPPGTGVDSTWSRQAIAHAEAVLERNPEDPGALELRGTVRYRRSRLPEVDDPEALLDAAASDLQTAVDEDPGRARAWAELSLLLKSQGRLGEARMAARRSREADPFLANDLNYLFTAATLALEVQNFERAEKLVRRGRRLFSEERAYPALHLQLLAGPRGPVYPPDTAWHLLRELEETMGGSSPPPAHLLVAGALVGAGMPDSARSVLDRAVAAAPKHPFTGYYGANVLAQLGDTAEAVRLLERYLAVYPERRSGLRSDWWFESLRDHPSFRRLVASPSGPETDDDARADR